MTSADTPTVSAKQKANALHSESDSLFRAYVEAASDIVYTLDLTGKFTFVNSYGLKLIGADSYDDVVGHSYLDIVAPESRRSTLDVFAQLLKTGELRDYEFAVLTRSGDRVFIEVNGRLLYQSGRLVGALGIGRDITERKRCDAQLKMFSKALDSAHDSAIITDLQGNIQYANLATQRVFNWPAARLTGVNLSTFFSKQDQVAWVLEQATGEGWSGQIVCQRYDGTPFSAFISISPVYGEEAGKPTAVSIILRDITQQERIEAELAAKNLELARANRLKSEFLANMSHELRTPMTSILGFSKLLSQAVYGELNERQQLYVDQIYHSGEHLLSLINEVLDLSKVEAGQMDLNPSSIHVATLCQDVITMVTTQAKMKDLTIHCEVAESLPALIADEVRVRQMLLNLLSNAIKFTPKGRAIGIRVHQPHEDQLTLTVWDEGIGIAPDQVSALFQPFQQLESPLSKQYEGTGLGLALTQKLTRLHGGDVIVRSQPDQGSEFTIQLPLNCRTATRRDEQHAVQDATLSDPLAIAPPSPQSTAQPILVVEDNPINALLLEHMLTHWGYQVHHCAHGQEALDWLSDHRPVLVLMDVQLPGVNGLELTQQIRQQPQWQDLPIVATTALAQPQDRDRCLAAGMQDYLSKPINHADLVAVLARYTCGQTSANA